MSSELFDNTSQEVYEGEPTLSPEEALKAVRSLFNGTIVLNYQYAYIGEDKDSGGGGKYDSETDSWQFDVIARPFFMDQYAENVGKVTVASDGTAIAKPPIDTIIRSVDSKARLAYATVTNETMYRLIRSSGLRIMHTLDR